MGLRFVVLITLSLTASCGSSPSRPHLGTAPKAAKPNSTESTVLPALVPTTEAGPALDGPQTTVARAIGASVEVHATAGGPVSATIRSPQASGSPLIFVVESYRQPWLKVLLPTRPNGSQGWVRDDQVSLSVHHYRILVELNAHRITVWQGSILIDREPIGVGRATTPTPGGRYYTKELFRPPDQKGPYGPYAYGLSGFSNVLEHFGGGDGVIGIHGTNQPQLLGQDVSHGCIRISNAGITKLATHLPLGVPVEIKA